MTYQVYGRHRFSFLDRSACWSSVLCGSFHGMISTKTIPNSWDAVVPLDAGRVASSCIPVFRAIGQRDIHVHGSGGGRGPDQRTGKLLLVQIPSCHRPGLLEVVDGRREAGDGLEPLHEGAVAFRLDPDGCLRHLVEREREGDRSVVGLPGWQPKNLQVPDGMPMCVRYHLVLRDGAVLIDTGPCPVRDGQAWGDVWRSDRVLAAAGRIRRVLHARPGIVAHRIFQSVRVQPQSLVRVLW
jgi:hypothetical protein